MLPGFYSDAVAPSQPIRHVEPFTSDSQGNGFVQFDNVPTSWAWTGTVNVPTAPIAAQFVAVVGDESWGTWSGPSPSPSIQVTDRLRLAITVTGLLPNTDYVAQFLARSDTLDRAPLVTPSAGFAVPPFSSLILVDNDLITDDTYYPDNVAGFFPTTGWGAVRVQVNNSGAQPVTVVLEWFTAGALPVAKRTMVVAPTTGFLACTIPNLGPGLKVSMLNSAGGPGAIVALVTVELTTETNVAWSNPLGDAILATASGVAVNAGATTTIAQTSTTFGGWVTIGWRITAFTNFNAIIEYMDSLGAFQSLFNCDQRAYASIAPGVSLLVPPNPLRVRVANNDAGAHNAGATVTADLYRAA